MRFYYLLLLFALPITISAQSVNSVFDPDNDTLNSFSKNFLQVNNVLNNATSPLLTPTHDGSGQGMHPSIIDFLQEYNIPSWNGYRYWMAMTPYPYGNAIFEDPNLLASNDGINWVVPPGITNPLITNPDSCHTADPDMIYNPVTNELWIYHYFTDYHKTDGYSCLNLIRINNLLQISGPVSVTPHTGSATDTTLLSPCIWHEDSDKWHMWAVFLNTQNIVYASSTNGINWSNFQLCTDTNGEYPFKHLDIGYKAWHISCKPNYNEHRIEFLVCARTYNSGLPISDTEYLIYGDVSMDSLQVFRTPIQDAILSISSSRWDNHALYRSTFVRYIVGCEYYYKIWYSANNCLYSWHIGLTEGFLGTSFTAISNLDLDIEAVSIFPNPATDKLTIVIANNDVTLSLSKGQIEISNIQGQIIRTFNTTEKQTSIDVSDLAGGVYIIKAKTEKGVAVKKFVKG